ncbi:alpha-(1,3)-fucosyltransferase 5-like [Asterias rubens]|uniref:alpha-(1,3)-fucosyltransferase 5-like n=1 Tax=Asterias rubens TaxID=7604 RepID=UPI001455B2A4|nr:alpha-(1,3)-fucosyltransferase 5-like [Asterias rubens]XP_033637707.1 alpha-(1,3)-fucosyltransferase 5-like [Asterias rubens]
MIGHLLRLRLLTFSLVFFIATSLTYLLLSTTEYLFESRGTLRKRYSLEQSANSHNQTFQDSASNLVYLEKKLTSESGLGVNPIIPPKSKLDTPKCNTTVSILIPGLYAFKAWREYLPFWQEFMRSAAMVPDSKGVRTLHLQCPRQQCDVNIRVTMNETFLQSSDAIILNMFPNILKNRLLDLLSHLRNVLHSKLHWFFYAMESPQMMTYWDSNIGKILYHHSILYHSSADIRLPYGEYIPGEPTQVGAQDWTVNKTSVIAWMASNCKNTFWPRNEFVKELQKHIPIDIYGGCGKLTCLPALSEKCTKLMASYKFYLSLENTECDEYITEKVWNNGLRQGVVPVVYGGRKEAYERLLPPKSFIHISDFDSTANLASYLKLLDKNKSMYNLYHAWRQHGRVKTVYPPLDSSIFCEVVPFVLKPPPAFKVVKDSEYFRVCKNLKGTFAEEGSFKTFSTWK